MKKTKLAVIFILFSTVLSHADNIRGPLVNILDAEILSADRKATEFDISPEEIFAVSPDYSNLPDKISIEIRSSETIKRFRDSFSLYSYTNVSPQPSYDIKSYHGKYSKSVLLPDRTRFFIDLKFSRSKSSDSSMPGTEVIDLTNLKDSKPLMFTILPVMKGVPDYLLSEKYKIKIKTYWPEQGKINVKVLVPGSNDNNPENTEDFSLSIDGNSHSKADNILLTSGIHKVTVSKKGYSEHNENITVKTNETRNVEILLKKNNPVVSIYSPDESELYIDGNIQNSRKISTLEPGEHTVLFKLGNYSLSRTIELEEGKNYVINLLLDIEVKEE